MVRMVPLLLLVGFLLQVLLVEAYKEVGNRGASALRESSRVLFAGGGELITPNNGDVIRRVRLCFVGGLGWGVKDEGDTAEAKVVALFPLSRCSRSLLWLLVPIRALLVGGATDE